MCLCASALSKKSTWTINTDATRKLLQWNLGYTAQCGLGVYKYFTVACK